MIIGPVMTRKLASESLLSTRTIANEVWKLKVGRGQM